MFQEWAYQDFDLFEFVGKDEFEDSLPHTSNSDFGEDLQKHDGQFATMQYAEITENMFGQHQPMMNDMNNGFMKGMF